MGEGIEKGGCENMNQERGGKSPDPMNTGFQIFINSKYFNIFVGKWRS